MTTEFIIRIGKETTMTILLVAAPMLLSGLIVGLLITMFQTVTQLRDQTLTFVPKIVAIITAVIFFFPWIVQVLVSYTIKILTISRTIL
jgi:flagellar biosynthesis protein FliQ